MFPAQTHQALMRVAGAIDAPLKSQCCLKIVEFLGSAEAAAKALDGQTGRGI